mmetsp:Transcript_4862/g.7803  ORF Transcript_4862/g.7803 Transcript_4862/m.7803 type:complete len:92 (+) Transcript_4862:26-301(+)
MAPQTCFEHLLLIIYSCLPITYSCLPIEPAITPFHEATPTTTSLREIILGKDGHVKSDLTEILCRTFMRQEMRMIAIRWSLSHFTRHYQWP